MYRIIYGFPVVTLALVIGSIMCFNTSDRIDIVRAELHKANALEHNTDFLFSNLKDAESSQRGYLLTQEVSYLDTYDKAVQPEYDEEFDKLIVTYSKYEDTLIKLRNLRKTKLTELALTINMARDKGFDVALGIVKTNRGKWIMDDYRKNYDELSTSEQSDIVGLLESLNEYTNTLQRWIIIQGISVIVLLIMSTLVFADRIKSG